MRPPALDGKRVCDASMSAGLSKKLKVTGAVSTNILFTDHTVHFHAKTVTKVDSVLNKKDLSLRMQAGVSNTPRYCSASLNPKVSALMFVSRNLCAMDWCCEVGGSSSEFREYFDSLLPDQLKVSNFGLYLQHGLTILHPRNTKNLLEEKMLQGK